ncbi:MAG: 3-hydroxyacyl-ACP dehydratase [Deltaproteobacteria bacterium RIFOXYD12_FULL_57_12]|nr:MAG: 3-hydroxyacyl-ACP dehydratase [Deltaproteobacteria bacterium RIFOXYD12_FULL_57_12]
MRVGVDLGSRTVKVAAVENGRLVAHRIVESSFDPAGQALDLIAEFRPKRVVATGYGRHLAQKHFAHEVITEIRAHALGARHCFPSCRTVIDIGGQDSKVIALDESGRVANFQMNDKCAAGTGRFLEIMAASLGYRLDEFGPAALASEHEAAINSMCTVFAESEVISLKNRGTPPGDIARAVHLSVVTRIIVMVNRLDSRAIVVFSGGVARNPCMVAFLKERLPEASLEAAEIPDLMGALGAALYAERH